ncbi:unnamed protein product [Clonostachys rosea]|uniref:RING-type domain-containing protein n=1 Tax=Bionectria ochroleuca TaxID=29856 RepID=A0ABY6TTC7_BIOOC|nr:unnamed protein product [Clonostachys rosea]
MEQIGFIIIAFFCLFVIACPLYVPPRYKTHADSTLPRDCRVCLIPSVYIQLTWSLLNGAHSITAIAARRRRRPQAAADPGAKNLIRARRKLSTVTACSFSVASAADSIQRNGSHDDNVNNARPGLGECPICIGPLVPESPSRLTQTRLRGDVTTAHQDVPSRRQSTNLTPEGRPSTTDEIPEHNSRSGFPFGSHWFSQIRRKGSAGLEEDCEVLTEVDDVLTINGCGHSFHSKCLISWFLMDRNDCPICRQLFYSPPSIPSRVFLRVSPPRAPSTGMWV